MLVYLIRHAQSKANARQDDGLNSGLSPLGLRQVAALAHRFSRTQFTAIYSSPFRRCLETAAPIARQAGQPIRLRPELCEFHGLKPGTSRKTDLAPVNDVAIESSGIIQCPEWSGPMNWPAIDETSGDMIERTRSLARFLKSRWPGEDDNVLVVGHGSPIARLIEGWLSDEPGPSFRFVIDNATLSLLRFRRGVSSLLQLNETSHLAGLISPESPFGGGAGALESKGDDW